MYSIETFKKGIEFLGITDRGTIKDILLAREDNLLNPLPSNEEKIAINKARMSFDKYKIPQGMTKKELTILQKDTQKEIDNWKARVRNPENNEATLYFCQAILDDWITKKKKIIAILKNHEGFGINANLNKAKGYPIEQLLDFNSAGFISCPFHGPEHTPSAKWYPKRNKIHCFGCGVDADSIDVYQKLNGVDFNTAVKALS